MPSFFFATEKSEPTLKSYHHVNAVVESWAKRAFLVLAFLLIIGVGWAAVYRAAYSPENRSDFTVYTAAGRAALAGTDIYQAQNARHNNYVYPPPFAVVAAGLAMLPTAWGSLLWYAVAVWLTIWSIQMCVEMIRAMRGLSWSVFWLGALVAITIVPWFIEGAAEGQATLLLSWLVVASLYWQKKGRTSLGAACLAGAILLKVIPVVLLGYFAMRKEGRFLLLTFAALIVGGLLFPASFFGWQKTAVYWQEWTAVVASPSLGNDAARTQSPVDRQLLSPSKSRSQTLSAVFWRLTGDRHARTIAAGLGVAMAVIMVVVAWGARAENEPLILAAGLIWMLLVSPLSEFHYYLLLLLPMTALIVLAGEQHDIVMQTLTRIAIAAFSVIAILALLFQPVRHFGLLCWATLGLWGVLLLAATRPPQFAGSERS